MTPQGWSVAGGVALHGVAIWFALSGLFGGLTHLDTSDARATWMAFPSVAMAAAALWAGRELIRRGQADPE